MLGGQLPDPAGAVAEHFGDGVEIVDYYHAGQHLWDVARALQADDPAATAAWAAP